ncbi:MerR family transcriptional regulator [Mycobacterium antarcticum]|uniref:MerR family transcriptional regulator n=1 Tax=Mycolicibacterium sp. TUM20984 TaxID=3023368 RepID=UPI00239EE166|nr:MerR family transcriptional regulator [Mycolicibacterium sp. TUM20984]GLP80320.1 hypothetical protein TUM20984_17400 [Mycolicibacterium sp. TUM20984]
MPEYRLEELAAVSAVSVRNIRAYRERGLLDPPRREGRSALYDDHHLAQLRTVNELLRKGFTSAHIAEFLAGQRQGHDLADTLGLPGGPPRRTAVALDIDVDGDEARRLVRHGLADIVDGRVTLIDPDLAAIVGGATEHLRYVQTILRVAEGITEQVEELAKSVANALAESTVEHLALGRRVVADRLEDALRRHLGTDVGLGGASEV